jgi:signal transduction histidine kinase
MHRMTAASSPDPEPQVRTPAQGAPGEDALLAGLMDAMVQPVLVLDAGKRLAQANRAFCDLVGKERHQLIGRFPGEAFGCSGCDHGNGDCPRAGANCGLVRAVDAGFSRGDVLHEFQLETEDGFHHPLRLRCVPVAATGELCMIIEDLSRSHRRDMLDRVFFHDLINSLGAIQGAAQMLQDATAGEDAEMAWLLAEQAQDVLDEVNSHRDLFDAETDELRVRRERVAVRRMLKRTATTYSAHQSFPGRIILVDPAAEDISVRTDGILLRRILGNMVKNGLEADQGPVVLNARSLDGGVVFEVRNQGLVPIEHRDRIFRRAYSTKGVGRGLGCYSMKLFGEGILGGRVWFTSEPGEGTTFRIWLPAVSPEDV